MRYPGLGSVPGAQRSERMVRLREPGFCSELFEPAASAMKDGRGSADVLKASKELKGCCKLRSLAARRGRTLRKTTAQSTAPPWLFCLVFSLAIFCSLCLSLLLSIFFSISSGVGREISLVKPKSINTEGINGRFMTRRSLVSLSGAECRAWTFGDKKKSRKSLMLKKRWDRGSLGQ